MMRPDELSRVFVFPLSHSLDMRCLSLLALLAQGARAVDGDLTLAQGAEQCGLGEYFSFSRQCCRQCIKCKWEEYARQECTNVHDARCESCLVARPLRDEDFMQRCEKVLRAVMDAVQASKRSPIERQFKNYETQSMIAENAKSLNGEPPALPMFHFHIQHEKTFQEYWDEALQEYDNSDDDNNKDTTEEGSSSILSYTIIGVMSIVITVVGVLYLKRRKQVNATERSKRSSVDSLGNYEKEASLLESNDEQQLPTQDSTLRKRRSDAFTAKDTEVAECARLGAHTRGGGATAGSSYTLRRVTQ